MKRNVRFALFAALALAAGDKKEPTSASTTTPPAAQPEATAKPSPSAEIPAGSERLVVTKGKGAFLIDAPLEKIKGSSEDLKGELVVDAKDLAKTKGKIGVKLSTLKTATFEGDAKKNDSQTEHARNWMEVGTDAKPETKAKYEWAELVVKSVETATPKLADVKEENGARVVKAKVTGDLTIHGVTSPKTVNVTATFKGPTDAPTSVELKTDQPFAVSMKEHGIMPRDKVGSFLNGALERIGKKIDDAVQVSFEATAEKK